MTTEEYISKEIIDSEKRIKEHVSKEVDRIIDKLEKIRQLDDKYA